MDERSPRYARQVVSPCVGVEGQRRLAAARAVVVGVGATGGVAASILARAGIGSLRVIDRDIVEVSNLQRQILFDDEDAREGVPKAKAAERHLRAANPEVRVEGIVADVVSSNIEALVDGADCILDGTDNFETRLLVNDVALARGLPWIYAGVINTYGHAMSIVPGRTACFRCYVPDLPGPGAVETCDTAGVLAPAVHAIGGLAAMEALKILSGQAAGIVEGLLTLDAWTGELRRIAIPRDPACRACGRGALDFLRGDAPPPAAVLCGRDAVQLRAAAPGGLDLDAIARRLAAAGAAEVRRGAYALRVRSGDLDATVFPDGRAIVKGTDDPGRARSFYARFVGA